MNREQLLKQLNAQSELENSLHNQMESRIEEANKEIEYVKQGWIDFVEEYFPDEILSIMKRYGNNGNVIHSNSIYSCAKDLHPNITIGKLSISFFENNLVFSKGNMVIGFRWYSKQGYERERYGRLYYNYDPVTFWTHIPLKIQIGKTKEDIERNAEAIKLTQEFHNMLNEFNNAIPDIYREIADRNAKYIMEKQNSVDSVVKKEEPTERKKYTIIIEIEE